MAFLSAFFLRRRASSSLMDETLLELLREGMVACLATFGSGVGVAACALRSCTRAAGCLGAGTAQGSLAQRRQLCVEKHESAAVDESRLRAIGLMRTALACTKSQSEARQSSVDKTLAPVFPTRSRLAAPRVVALVRRRCSKPPKTSLAPGAKAEQSSRKPRRRGCPAARRQWATPPLYQKGSTPTRPAH